MQNEKREIKPNIKFNYRRRFGKSKVDIECPFCREITTAYVWGLAGSGKKCSCGALHGQLGTLAPVKK